MIIRAILGVVLSGGLSIGALYGAEEFLGLETVASGDTAAVVEPAIVDPVDEEPIYEPRLELPYADGQAASWLANVLAGSGPYDVEGESVDIAAIAARAAAGDRASVTCDSSHVAFHCNLVDEDADIRYGFGLQNNADGGYEIPDGNVRTYSVN